MVYLLLYLFFIKAIEKENMVKKEWFEEWFDSKYYHLLYNNRDHSEASNFIHNLVEKLELNKGDRILDMGCGKGRHAIQLNKYGYDVTGLDISPESIIHANKYSNKTLDFYIHDMRKGFRHQYFHAIFSLFTSFGYFKTIQEHKNVLQHNYNGLRKGGIFLIDFMNSHKVVNNLVHKEQKQKDDTLFRIVRSYENGYIKKQISFDVKGNNYTFTESVYGFGLKELKSMLEEVGFKIETIAGNYDLENFIAESSDRLIIIAKKTL